MSTQQNSKGPAVVLGMLTVVATAGAGFFVMLAPDETKPVIVVPAAEDVVAVPADPRPAPQPMPVVEPLAQEQPTSPASKPNRLARDLQREQIWTALNRAHNLKPAAPGSAAPSSSAASLLPTLDGNYVREAVRDRLAPLAKDCYDTVLNKHDAGAGGKLIMSFTIVGVEEIGSVVEESAIDESSTFDNELMRECMSEAMMIVTFPPPPQGGRAEVSYPFVFSAN